MSLLYSEANRQMLLQEEFHAKTHIALMAVDHWLYHLDFYSLSQLRYKPDALSWSLGQLYLHLMFETTFYVNQIKVCLKTQENVKFEMNSEAKSMFANNSFPNIRIVGDSALSAKIPQPDNIDMLKKAFLKIKKDLQSFNKVVSDNGLQGKTKHPGLGYFTAINWLQFTEMHFRHHEKQRDRILNFSKLQSK